MTTQKNMKMGVMGLVARALLLSLGLGTYLGFDSFSADAFVLQGRAVYNAYMGRFDCEIYNQTPYFVTIQSYEFYGMAQSPWGGWQQIRTSQHFCVNGQCGIAPGYMNMFFGPYGYGMVAPTSCVGYSIP